MTMYSLGVASMLTMISFATSAIDLKPHDKFLRENFEITDTKEIWGDDGWWVSCFFVDLDNDGFEEVISTTVSQTDRSGDASTFWTTKPDGKLHRLNEDNLLATNFFFASFHYSHYRLDLGENRKYFIGLDMDAGYLNDDNATMRVKTPDCIFGIDAGNQLSVEPFSPSLDAVFFANATSRVERIYSEGFEGFGFKYVPQKTWFQGYEFPRTPDPIEPPEKFHAFLSSFQKEAQIRSGETNDVSVFAVLLDANNDGLSDCYLSSSVDGTSKDVYRWMLFVNEKGVLKKAGVKVKSVPHRDDLPSLEPSVEARKDAFCRVVRFDASPTYIVLDESKIKDDLVKKTITNHLTHSIEKIPCHEYSSKALAENSLNSQDREIATFVTDFIKPTEWDNQDYWREHWSVATVSFDLDGDGLCDALVCTPDQQASRRLGWLPVHQGADGGMKIECDLENTECISCCQDSFCMATISNEVKVLVGLDAYVEKYEARKRVWSKTGDVMIKADSKGKLKTMLLPGGVEGLVREAGFCRLEHVVPKWFVGYRLELKPGTNVLGTAGFMPLRAGVLTTAESQFRIDWFNGVSTVFSLDESKDGFSLVRRAFMNGRIKCIEKIACVSRGSDVVEDRDGVVPKVSQKGVPLPMSLSCPRAKHGDSPAPDKIHKKIVRHKVRDEDDVIGISIFYGVPTEEIRRRNNLMPGEGLRLGQMLELEVDQDFEDSF